MVPIYIKTTINNNKMTNNYTKFQASFLRLLFSLFILAGFGASNVIAQTTTTVTASGSFTIPNGVTSISAYLWGGGGAGAGTYSSGTGFLVLAVAVVVPVLLPQV